MQNIRGHPHMMPQQQTVVSRLYQSVIDDVCTNTREIFLDEGVDESTIQAFKKTWEEKVMSSKAVANHQIQNQGVYMLQQGRSATPMLLKNGVTQQLLQYSQHTPLLSRAAHQAQAALPAGIMFQAGDSRPQKFQVAHVSRPGQLVGGQKIVSSNNVSATSSNKVLQIDGSTDCPEEVEMKCQASPSNLMEKSKNDKLRKKANKKKLSLKKRVKIVLQFDGENDDSSEDEEEEEEEEEDDEDEDDDDDESDNESDHENGENGNTNKTVKNEDKELCSDDDVSSEEDPTELFDTDNVVVCQYDKIHRTKSRWKFNLKVGIMSLNGRDHVFQKAVGEANW